jgi:hypothetical protein
MLIEKKLFPPWDVLIHGWFEAGRQLQDARPVGEHPQLDRLLATKGGSTTGTGARTEETAGAPPTHAGVIGSHPQTQLN